MNALHGHCRKCGYSLQEHNEDPVENCPGTSGNPTPGKSKLHVWKTDDDTWIIAPDKRSALRELIAAYGRGVYRLDRLYRVRDGFTLFDPATENTRLVTEREFIRQVAVIGKGIVCEDR